MKELRLAGADDMAAGNALLPAFMADYNARFAKPPRLDKDLHRPLAPGDDLDGSFAWRVECTVSHALTVQYDGVMFILEPSDVTRALPRKKVTVHDFPDGRVEVRHKGLALPYRTFDRITRVDQGAIVVWRDDLGERPCCRTQECSTRACSLPQINAPLRPCVEL